MTETQNTLAVELDNKLKGLHKTWQRHKNAGYSKAWAYFKQDEVNNVESLRYFVPYDEKLQGLQRAMVPGYFYRTYTPHRELGFSVLALSKGLCTHEPLHEYFSTSKPKYSEKSFAGLLDFCKAYSGKWEIWSAEMVKVNDLGTYLFERFIKLN